MTFELATKFKPDADEPFAAAVAAGMKAAELWTGPEVLAAAGEVVERARRFSLRYALHFPNRRDLTPEQLAAFVELYRALDCRSFTIHELEYDRYASDLERIAPDLRPAVENSMLAYDDLPRWATTRPGLTLDVEHIWCFTVRGAPLSEVVAVVRDLLKQHAHKVRHVHLPGYWAEGEEHRPLHRSPDFAGAMLGLLADVGYSGFVVSEADTQYQTVPEMSADVEFVAAWRRRRTLAESP